MRPLLSVIQGTPVWVWGILLYLLFIGIRATKARTIYLPKLFIIPVVLITLKCKIFLSNHALVFTLAIITSAALGFILHANSPIEILKNLKSIKLPGSYSTLFILCAFFIVKYFFGYLTATDPMLAIKYLLFEITIDGLLAGYLLGRTIRYAYQYLKA